MARSKQTARKSTGGLHVPQKQLVHKVCKWYTTKVNSWWIQL